ncbi:MAG: substrate-binding domain-containing protein [Amaricoccus sp.]|uniref:substrate-binding domain-containing protein n=1 Tax=Amaricoccus sp. TaxID=1872485 RepID=UPI0039E5CE56
MPNQSGRSLRSGRTGIVAAVIPSQAGPEGCDPGLFVVLEGLRRSLQQRGLDLILLFRGADEDPLQHLQRIVQRRIADSVVIIQTIPGDARIAFLKATGVEYVAFGRSAGIDGYSFVDFDFEAMAVDAARRFVADGHRRLGVATAEDLLNYQALLIAAFQAEVIRLGLPPETVRLIPMANGEPTAEARALMAGPRAPTAYVATHESLAMSLYRELTRLGHRVGDDVAVLCTFPPFEARWLVPALTYYDSDLNDVGRELALRLIAQANGDGEDLASRLMPLRFTPRQSHGRAASRLRA